KQSVFNWESGISVPRRDTLRKISEVFHVSLTDLIIGATNSERIVFFRNVLDLFLLKVEKVSDQHLISVDFFEDDTEIRLIKASMSKNEARFLIHIVKFFVATQERFGYMQAKAEMSIKNIRENEKIILDRKRQYIQSTEWHKPTKSTQWEKSRNVLLKTFFFNFVEENIKEIFDQFNLELQSKHLDILNTNLYTFSLDVFDIVRFNSQFHSMLPWSILPITSWIQLFYFVQKHIETVSGYEQTLKASDEADISAIMVKMKELDEDYLKKLEALSEQSELITTDND
ncbi:helix-turn-helix domain-containing protein, partial [Oenococcus oeni]|uniref:helix-turn-helix domain-containing protein n=1 Tax=Oenococcus oeni TaxID=1247 RepID=UPI000A4EE6E0